MCIFLRVLVFGKQKYCWNIHYWRVLQWLLELIIYGYLCTVCQKYIMSILYVQGKEVWGNVLRLVISFWYMAGWLSVYGCLILVIAHPHILLSALTAQAPRRPITMPKRVRSYKAIMMQAPLPCRVVKFTADRAGLSPLCQSTTQCGVFYQWWWWC